MVDLDPLKEYVSISSNNMSNIHLRLRIFDPTIIQQMQCSRCLAIHIARPLKNGGALPIFHANPSYFDDSEIQSSNFQ